MILAGYVSALLQLWNFFKDVSKLFRFLAQNKHTCYWYFVNRHSDRSLKMPKTQKSIFYVKNQMNLYAMFDKFNFWTSILSKIMPNSCQPCILFIHKILHTIIYLECNDFNPLYFSGDFINATLWQYHDISYHSYS